MHEFSIASAVVERAVHHARGRPVTAVTLRVGRLRQVIPDSLDFAFGIVSRETVCEGARLEQVVIPARLCCETCRTEWGIDLPDFRCPTCGERAAVVSGEELEVESIEIEEAACTASG